MNHNRRPAIENIRIQEVLDGIKIPVEGLQIVPISTDKDTFILFDNKYTQKVNPHDFTFN